jgi:hypothetical protein
MSVLPKDITYIRTIIANVVLVGEPGTPDWVLVDAGVATFADNISKIALERFGTEQPRAIVLTHGHFDHVGSLREMLERWNVPVYAHVKELPYLTGKADYPEADPSVGGKRIVPSSQGMHSLRSNRNPPSPFSRRRKKSMGLPCTSPSIGRKHGHPLNDWQPLSRRWPSPDMASPCMETSWNEGPRH